MPSSISSSEAASSEAASSDTVVMAANGIATGERFERPGFVRPTASDRPGVAQPVPVRDIPPQPWQRIFIAALVLATLMMAAWEWHWRAFGATPSYRNSDGQWAQQRRRINAGEGGKTVLIGSSRVLFDVQLPVWEAITGERPIQLALEGTSPLPILEDLAADPDFTGRLLVGVTPGLFFSGGKLRADVVAYTHDQGPSQRSGNWLSQQLLEPWLGFYDPDFALATVVKRQAWPARDGVPNLPEVRKLMVQDVDRNTRMWGKLETDAAYRAMVQRTWLVRFGRPPPHMDTPAKAQAVMAAQIQRAAIAVRTLRARGVDVLFIRPPSTGPLYAGEQNGLPRARTWDRLLQATGAPGIHFEDYPELQGYWQPEWSHLSASEADRFTAALVPIIQREYWREKSRPTATAATR
ncbi:MAG: hypothetical protein LH470_01165 [Lysobacter sp.]|nr:hypothetical protein [Lysobacter sp.]